MLFQGCFMVGCWRHEIALIFMKPTVIVDKRLIFDEFIPQRPDFLNNLTKDYYHSTDLFEYHSYSMLRTLCNTNLEGFVGVDWICLIIFAFIVLVFSTSFDYAAWNKKQFTPCMNSACFVNFEVLFCAKLADYK